MAAVNPSRGNQVAPLPPATAATSAQGVGLASLNAASVQATNFTPAGAQQQQPAVPAAPAIIGAPVPAQGANQLPPLPPQQLSALSAPTPAQMPIPIAASASGHQPQPPAAPPPPAALTAPGSMYPNTSYKQSSSVAVTIPGQMPSPTSGKQPPGSPGLIDAQPSQVAHVSQDGKPVENYIPARFPDLRDQLIADRPDYFKSGDTKQRFFKFCRWLSLRNTMRIKFAFGDVPDKYAFVDPDNDAENPCANMNSEEKASLQDSFEAEFKTVLDKGEFDEIPEEHFKEALNERGEIGLDVEPCDPNVIDYKMWFRGTRSKEVVRKSWRTLWRSKKVSVRVYQRLALRFKLRPQHEVDAYLATSEHKLLRCIKAACCCCKPCFDRKTVKLNTGSNVDAGLVYLKLFKDVDQMDLDMLLPGAKARFSWFDWLMIWGPVLFGVGSAIYKAVDGSVEFNNLVQIATSLLLIVMPLTWGFKAYVSVKDKMHEYERHLNRLFLLHNLNNNAGVVAEVLEEAQEQEDNEAMLAYFFLWRGMKCPTPMSKLELDKAVEAFLAKMVDRQGLNVVLDFEVNDSLDKLERMGILSQDIDPTSGVAMFKVLPLDEALEKVHIKNFDELREVQGAKRSRSQAAAAAAARGPQGPPGWHECVGVYPTTGQKIRYFWNEDTGESTYTEPERFIALSGNSAVMHGGSTLAATASMQAAAGKQV